MITVKACYDDLTGAWEVCSDAIAYLKEQGVDQWQNGYPNPEVLKEDADLDRLYVVKDNDTIVGVYVLVEHDPNYDVVSGSWRNDEPYIAVHRFAVRRENKRTGVASFIFAELMKKYAHIRIDTHAENVPMNKCLVKNGFVYRGIIYLEDGAARNAYDYLR